MAGTWAIYNQLVYKNITCMSHPSTPTIVVTCNVIMIVFCFSIVIRVSTRILWLGDLGQWFQLIIV